MLTIDESFYDPTQPFLMSDGTIPHEHTSPWTPPFYSGVNDGCVPKRRCHSAACWACAAASHRWLVGKIAEDWQPTGPVIEVVADFDLGVDVFNDEVAEQRLTDQLSVIRNVSGVSFKHAGSRALQFYSSDWGLPPWNLRFNFVIELLGIAPERSASLCEELDETDDIWSADSRGRRPFVTALADATTPAALRHLHHRCLIQTDYPQSDEALMARVTWLHELKALDLTFRGRVS